MIPGVGGRLLARGLLLGLAGLAAACTPVWVAPVLPGPHVEQIEAPYDQVWAALVTVLARENVQVRAIARDSGVIASEATPTTIGLYADCGRFGGNRVVGDAQVAYTVFVRAATPAQTVVQVNTRMRTENYSRRGGTPRARPALDCASTGRWEANLLDTVRALLGKP